MEHFWPDASRANATNNLNKILFMARRALEPELAKGAESAYLKRNGELIALQLSNANDVDVLAFEAIAQQTITNRNPELLSRAATLYKGELLPEDRFEEKIIACRDALDLLARQVLESWALYLDESGDVDQCVHIAQRLIELDDANEWCHRLLMRLYHDQSQKSLAIEQYHRCREAVIRTVGCPPATETEQLFDAISKSDSDRTTEFSRPTTLTTVNSNCSVLAVMPFINVDHLDCLEYLCEGLTENLISRLSRLGGYDVLSRSLVYQLREKQTVDPVRLRSKHGVDLLLLGRLRSTSERLHLWVELVRTNNQSLVWAEFYDVDQAQLQAVGDQIAEAIADGLDQTLDKSGNTGVSGSETESVSAFHEYLKGRYHWNKRSAASLPLAKEHFVAAIDKDPLYASAYAGLADCYNLLSLYTDSCPRDSMPKARAAAKKALQFAPPTAELHASLAYYEMSYE